MEPRDSIGRAGGWLDALELWAMVALIAVLVGFAVLQIVLRNFFHTGIVWSDTLLRHVVLWASFMGAARATAENRHIRISLLPRLLPPGAARWVDRLGEALSATVCAVLTYASLVFVRDEYQAAGIAFAGIPQWVLELIFPFGFALMAFRFTRRAFGPHSDTPPL